MDPYQLIACHFYTNSPYFPQKKRLAVGRGLYNAGLRTEPHNLIRIVPAEGNGRYISLKHLLIIPLSAIGHFDEVDLWAKRFPKIGMAARRLGFLNISMRVAGESRPENIPPEPDPDNTGVGNGGML